MELIKNVAYDVVRLHQRHMVVSPWALMATVLLQNREGISVMQLVRESDWLKRQAQNYGAYVDWPGELFIYQSILNQFVAFLKNFIMMSEKEGF